MEDVVIKYIQSKKDKHWSGTDTIRSQYPALKIKREITKYINWQQFTKGTRDKTEWTALYQTGGYSAT